MTALLTIGEFSRLTHVSVKALRHYHEVGLLAPADVEPGTGYRFYATAQAPTAQLIRRFRDMDMPLEQIKAVLVAANPDERDRVIVAHLRSMQRQLEQTQATVASLRALLEGGGSALTVEFRTLEATPALVALHRVRWDDTETWLRDMISDLRNELRRCGGVRAGPDGAVYSTEFFEAHVGDVSAFIPIIAAPSDATAPVGELPAGPMAVTVHRGAFGELDRTYAALGTFVAERGIGTSGPIRENYLVSAFDSADDNSLVTEVCWPTRALPA